MTVAEGTAVDRAAERGLTLAGFARGDSVNLYTRQDRVTENVQ
jgi:formate dehydrogenase assembly factor FdhD